jgi:hypothetical protein
MARELEEWGGEVRVPGWVRKVLRLGPPAEDSPERRAEAHRRTASTTTVGQNADKAGAGALTELYWEGRRKRR